MNSDGVIGGLLEGSPGMQGDSERVKLVATRNRRGSFEVEVRARTEE